VVGLGTKLNCGDGGKKGDSCHHIIISGIVLRLRQYNRISFNSYFLETQKIL